MALAECCNCVLIMPKISSDKRVQGPVTGWTPLKDEGLAVPYAYPANPVCEESGWCPCCCSVVSPTLWSQPLETLPQHHTELWSPAAGVALVSLSGKGCIRPPVPGITQGKAQSEQLDMVGHRGTWHQFLENNKIWLQLDSYILLFSAVPHPWTHTAHSYSLSHTYTYMQTYIPFKNTCKLYNLQCGI